MLSVFDDSKTIAHALAFEAALAAAEAAEGLIPQVSPRKSRRPVPGFISIRPCWPMMRRWRAL